jgi:hypothetical protein
MQRRIFSYDGWPMTDVRLRRCLAAALLVTAGALSGCTSTAACGAAATVDAKACQKPVATAAGGLPTFTDGVGMSEWLTYRSTDIRALSYSPGVVQRSASNRIDALVVEECAPLEHSVTVHQGLWRVTGAGGGKSGRVAGELVAGEVKPDRPLSLSAGKCAQTTLAIAVPAHAKPATAHYGPVATWVLPSD